MSHQIPTIAFAEDINALKYATEQCIGHKCFRLASGWYSQSEALPLHLGKAGPYYLMSHGFHSPPLLPLLSSALDISALDMPSVWYSQSEALPFGKAGFEQCLEHQCLEHQCLGHQCIGYHCLDALDM